MDQLPAKRGTTTLRAPSEALANALSFIDEEASRLIAADAAMLTEAKELLPALTARAHQVATRDEIKNIIIARFILYPQSHRDDWQWDLWWADYYSALEGLTAEAINAGMTAWVAKPDSEFLPKPGALKAIASKSITPTLRTRRIFNDAVALALARDQPRAQRRYAAPERITKTKDDKALVRQLQAEYRASVEAHQREVMRDRPARRDTSGPPAPGHHATAATLEAMRRRLNQ